MYKIIFLSLLIINGTIIASDNTHQTLHSDSTPKKSPSEIPAQKKVYTFRYREYDDTKPNAARDMSGWEDLNNEDVRKKNEEWRQYFGIAIDKVNSLEARLSTLNNLTHRCTTQCTSQSDKSSKQHCIQRCNALHTAIKLSISQEH